MYDKTEYKKPLITTDWILKLSSDSWKEVTLRLFTYIIFAILLFFSLDKIWKILLVFSNVFGMLFCDKKCSLEESILFKTGI